nr:hypothetical protein [Hyalangium gracile]
MSLTETTTPRTAPLASRTGAADASTGICLRTSLVGGSTKRMPTGALSTTVWSRARSRSASARAALSRSRYCSRSVTSRMMVVMDNPSGESRGLRLMSSGSSVPSLRRPRSASPWAIFRTLGAATYSSRWRRWTSRRRSGMSRSTCWPSSSSRP